MDFGFSFTAPTPALAREILERMVAPRPVKDFLTAAIDAAIGHLADDGYLLYVAAAGHLCEGADDNIGSVADLTVEPVMLEGVTLLLE